MKIHLALLITCSFFKSVLNAQTTPTNLDPLPFPMECWDHKMDPPIDKTLFCSPVAPEYEGYYNRYQFYEDKFAIQPEVTLRINFVIWQKDDGSGNWVNKPEHLDRLHTIIQWLNGIYKNYDPPSDSIPGVGPNIETKIAFELGEIYFIPNSTVYYADGQAAANIYHTGLMDYYPEAASSINIHITGFQFATPAPYGGWAALPSYDMETTDHFVVTGYMDPEKELPELWPHADWGFAKHLAHELGHDLDLVHTYGGANCDATNPDYLDDVFNGVCPHAGGFWGIDPYDPNNSATNNIMGGTGYSAYFSPKQIYRTHRALALKSVRKYANCVAEEGIAPLEITTSQTWDFDIRMYNPILIKRGATLTITCRVLMNTGHKIMVEPGAKLVLNGGVLTAACDDFWGGIEVWGQHNQPQNSIYQGIVEIKNNALIEHAKEAIAVWKNEDWAKTGGIVRASNSRFINNWRSAEFMYYHYYSTNGKEIKNQSFFTNCSFEWNDDFKSAAMAPAITMYQVNGIRIAGCSFTDNSTILPRKSVGIHTIDAGFVADAITKNATGTPDNDWYDDVHFTPNRFLKLETGIRVSNASAITNVTIDRALFQDNITGIAFNALDNILITRNQFITNYTGISGLASTAYTIEGNRFEGINNSSLHTGLRLTDSGTEANEVYRNQLSNLQYGNFAEGQNANDFDVLTQASGLEWKCEFNNNNWRDLNSRMASGLNDPVKGVRLFQGAPGSSTGNRFSAQITNLSPLNDYHLNTDDVQTMTYYAFNSGIEIPNQVVGLVDVQIISVKNECKSRFKLLNGNNPGGEVIGRFTPEVRQTVGLRLQDVTGLIAERNQLLTQRLEGGGRPELIQLISGLNKTNRLQIKAVLEAESPWLGEEVLRHLGEQPVAVFPHQWYKDLVEQNLEVAQNKNFRAFLRHKNQPLPEGMVLDLEAKLGKQFTERGLLEVEILELSSEAERLHNALLNDAWSEDAEINWAAIDQLVQSRSHALQPAEQLDGLLAQNRQSEAASLLSHMQHEVLALPEGYNKQSLLDLVSFKTFALSLLQPEGAYRPFTATDLQTLRNMAGGLQNPAATQAQNLLCFFAGECAELLPLTADDIKNPSGKGKSLENMPIAEQSLLVQPNPNKGIFSFQIASNKELERINLTDLQGRSCLFTLQANSDHAYNVHQNKALQGIYLLEVLYTDGSSSLQRILVQPE